MKYATCKDCPDNDSFYGCIYQDCDVYKDLQAEAGYEQGRDEMEADNEHEKRKDARLGY